ncbi:MAG: alanine racemase, partial [Nitrospirota bacterium]
MSAPPAQILIDLAALRRNVASLVSLIGPACELLAVVKSDGYGHGLVESARAALAGGARRAGVSAVMEGIALREAGVGCPILVMGPFEESDASAIVARRLTPVINRPSQLTALAAATRAGGHAARSPLPVHVKADTGMGRLGLLSDELWPLLERVMAAPELTLEGVMTHFAEADQAGSAATAEQGLAFGALLKQIRDRYPSARGLVAHAANSAALLTQPDSRHQMVRAGLAIYGVLPSPHCGNIVPLAPVMRWTSRIAHLRRLPAGASIGYGRTFTTARP